MRNSLICGLAAVVFLLPCFHAHAGQYPQPQEPCAAPQTGQTAWTGAPDQPGADVVICDGGAWNTLRDYAQASPDQAPALIAPLLTYVDELRAQNNALRERADILNTSLDDMQAQIATMRTDIERLEARTSNQARAHYFDGETVAAITAALLVMVLLLAGGSLSFHRSPARRRNESGNVFFTLFGAIALVGVIGVATATLMRGPVGTVITLNQRAKIESQLQIARKLIALDAAQNAGDCDSDSFIEPAPPDSTCATPITGGGCIPATVGAAKNDPWGTLVGYCAWNHGPSQSGNGCAAGLLQGKNGMDKTVIAVISAGADRQFQTTCQADPNYVATPAGSDDIVMEWTFDEAQQGLGGGLWKLKSGDPDTMVPDNKNLEISSDSTFTSGSTASFQNANAAFGAGSVLSMAGGSMFSLPTEAPLVACNAINTGLLRRNTAGGTQEVLEICDGAISTWTPIGGSGGVAAAGSDGDLQFNAGGVMSATSNLNWSGTSLDITGNLGITGNGSFSGTLGVTGAATLSSTLGVTGLTTLDGGLNVTGDTDLNDNLNVDGTTDMQGAATAHSTLDVTGATTLSSTLDVTGAATLSSTLGVTGATTLSSTLGVTGAATLSSTLGVTGATTLSSTLDVTGAADLSSTLSVGGATTLQSTLDIQGNISNSAGTAVTVGDDLGVTGIFSIGAQGQLNGGDCSSYAAGAITFDAVNDELLLCSSVASNTWVTVGTSGGGGGGGGGYWTKLVDGRLYYNTDKVGVGTADPQAEFHVAGDLLTEGTYSGTASVPVSGAGTRMFFDSETGAFRAGTVGSTQWDDSQIGNNSFAGGRDATASGTQGFAFGYIVSSLGNNAVTFGNYASNSGQNSYLFGNEVDIGDGTSGANGAGNGNNSVAFGLGDTGVGTRPRVSGDSSFGIFMGDHANVNLATSNVMGLFGGRMIIDPAAPAAKTNPGGLELDVEGDVGATQYCDTTSSYCFTAQQVATGSIGVPGNDGEVVYNSGGSLGADSGFYWDRTNTRLGLGTNAPAGRLHTEDTQYDLGTGNCPAGYTEGDYDGQADAADCRRVGLFVSADGKVGVGTAGPWDDMDVFDYEGLSTFSVGGTGDGSNYAVLGLTDLNSGKLWAFAHSQSTANAFNLDYYDGATWSAHMVVLPDGSVTFGDTAPDDASGSGGQKLRLDVEGPVGGSYYCDENGLNCFTASDVAGNSAPGGEREIHFTSGGATATDPNFVFTSAGRLGIGTAAPTHDLTLGQNKDIAFKSGHGDSANPYITNFDIGYGTAALLLINRNNCSGGAASSFCSTGFSGYNTIFTGWNANAYGFESVMNLGTDGQNNANILSLNNNYYVPTVGLQANINFDALRTTGGHTKFAKIGMETTDIGNATYKGDLVFYTANAAAPAERVRITSAGAVSISNTGVVSDGSGSGGQALLLDVEGPVGGSYYCDENGLNCFTASDVAGNSAPGGEREIHFTSGGATVTDPGFVFTSAGRLGVGMAAPSAQLHVGAAETAPNGLMATIKLENWAAGSGNAWFLRAGATGTTTPAGGFSIGDNTTYRMVIDNAGNVGIGTTAPAYALDIKKDMGANPGLRIWNESATDGRAVIEFEADRTSTYVWDMGIDTTGGATKNFELRDVTASGSPVRLAVDTSGHVGIGSASPDELLFLSGGNLAAVGTYGSGPALSLSGDGTRMFWYPKKGAFRAMVADDGYGEMDDVNIGNYSTAFGRDTFAKGEASMAWGYGAVAAGSMSQASGLLARAYGAGAIAMGNYVDAGDTVDTNGNSSMAIGLSGVNTANFAKVTGNNSLMIVMQDQHNVNMTAQNTMALLGGKLIVNPNTAQGAGMKTAPSTGGAQDLELDIVGDIGATNYCDEAGNDCFTAAGVSGAISGAVPGAPDRGIQFNSNGAFGADANFVYTSTGRLGIGTASPNQKLSVVHDSTGQSPADFNQYAFMAGIEDDGLAIGDFGTFNVLQSFGSKPLAINPAGNNVGIGTNNPAGTLEIVNSTGGFTPANYLQITGSTADGLNPPGISLKGGDLATSYPMITNANAGLSLQLFSGSSAAYPNAMGVTLDSGTNGTGVVSMGLGGAPSFHVSGTGNVGIGNSNPGELLFISGGNLAATGTFGSGPALSLSGAGARMMWYPKKAAFRAGGVSGTNWNDVNIGNYSVAFGSDSKANGDYSFAAGTWLNASGQGATAFGNSNTSSGVNAMAWGDNTTASAVLSTAWGAGSTASGQRATAIGTVAIASGYNSLAFGQEVKAGSGTAGDGKGDYSLALGLANNTAASAAEYPKVEGVGSFAIFMQDQKNVNLSTASVMALLGGKLIVNPNTAQGAAMKTAPSTGGAQDLELDVVGDIGATNYCDEAGNNCFTAAGVSGAISGAVPGAPDRGIQFNSGGAFAADADFIWDRTDNYLGVGTGGVYSYLVNIGSGYPTLAFNAYKTPAGYVAGTAGFGGFWQFNNGTGDLVYWTGTNVAAGANHVNTNHLTITTAGALQVRTDTAQPFLVEKTDGTDLLSLEDAGGGTYRLALPQAGSALAVGQGGIQFPVGGNSGALDYSGTVVRLGANANWTGTGLYAGATEILRTSAAGVGIGDTTPDDGSGSGGQALKLDVEGPVGGSYYCDENGLNCFTAAGVSGAISGAVPGAPDRGIQFNSGGAFAADANFVFTSAGRVGIGIGTPAAQLHVSAYEDSPNGTKATIKIENWAPGSGNAWFLRAGATGTTTPAGGFSIGDNTDYRLAIDANGYVGIGTVSPAMMLDVYRSGASAGLPAASGSSQPGLARFANGADVALDIGVNGAAPYQGWIQVTQPSDLSVVHSLLLNPNGGNVGIGTTSLNEFLTVNGNISVPNSGRLNWAGSSVYFIEPRNSASTNGVWASAASVSVLIDSNNASTTQFFRIMNNNPQEASASELFRVQENGYVGIGNFSSDTVDSALHVQSGDIRLDGGAGNQAGCLRFDDTTDKLQFSHDCSTFTDMGTATAFAAGNDGEIQFNSNGAFGTNANFFWDDANTRLGIGTNTPQYSLVALSKTWGDGIVVQDLGGGGEFGFSRQYNAIGTNHDLAINANGGIGFVPGHSFPESNTRAGYKMYFDSSGLLGIATLTPAAALDVQAAITAASGSAKGVNFTQTLTAAANNDALTALYIDPTFTDGAYTGVTHNGLIVASGNVGIGATSPGELLYLSGGNLAAVGTYGSGPALAESGAGTRMVWYPKKAAFRAGYISGTQWDDANIGDYSVSMGNTNQASGQSSVAMGVANVASGTESTALGSHTVAAGTDSMAWGYTTFAYGSGSTAFGEYVQAGDTGDTNGNYSLAIGLNNTSTANYAKVTGNGSLMIAMQDQHDVNMTANNTMALLGGGMIINPNTGQGAAMKTAPSTGGAQDLELDVVGDIGATNYCDEAGNNCFTAASVAGGGGTPAGNNGEIQFNSNGALGANANFFWDDGNGRLGIGTNAPASQFEVSYAGLSHFRVDQGSSVDIYRSDGFNSGSPLFLISNADVTNGEGQGLQIWAGNGNADYPLRVQSLGGAAELLAVRGDGRIGIGTATPGDMLYLLNPAGSGGGITIDTSGGTSPEIMLRRQGTQYGRFYATSTGGEVVLSATSTTNGLLTLHSGQALIQTKGTLGKSSGSANYVNFDMTPTINMTGTYAGNVTEFRVSPYLQSTTGIATHLLMDVGTNSAAAGAGTHTSVFAITAAGSVGIGTAAPGVLVDIASSVVDSGMLRLHNTNTTGSNFGITFKSDLSNAASRNWGIAVDAANVGDFSIVQSDAKGGAPFTAGTSRLYISQAGNVGIGDTSPSEKLTLLTTASQDGIAVKTAGTNQPTIYVTDTTNNTAGGLRLAGGSSDLFQIGGGQGSSAINAVSIGTDVFGSASNAYLDIYDTAFALMQGDVGIGTASPDQGKVEVKGGSVCVDTNSDDNATSCIASESDMRLKRNVKDLDYALDTLMQLRPVSFDWKYDDPEILKHYPLISRFEGQPHSIGLIAQDVQKLVPEAIESETVGDAEVQYLQLDYSKLTPVVIKAVQDLKTEHDGVAGQVQQLRATLATLESDNAQLKTEVEALKSERVEMKAAIQNLTSDMAGMKAYTGYGIDKAEIGLAALAAFAASLLAFAAGAALRRRRGPG